MAYRQKKYNYNDKLTKDQNLLMDKLYKMRMSGHGKKLLKTNL